MGTNIHYDSLPESCRCNDSSVTNPDDEESNISLPLHYDGSRLQIYLSPESHPSFWDFGSLLRSSSELVAE